MDFKDQPESIQHTTTSAEDITEKRQIIRHNIDFMEAGGKHDEDLTEKWQRDGR